MMCTHYGWPLSGQHKMIIYAERFHGMYFMMLKIIIDEYSFHFILFGWLVQSGIVELATCSVLGFDLPLA